MVKKITKYLKFVVCCALIMSLVAPSYAALSASDGSAFVTKAEFDSALADFNARLTTFEAGINSKIDSQVTSYLDRNGIWNGKEQIRLYGHASKIIRSGSGTNIIPLIEEINKSGLLFMDIKFVTAMQNTQSYAFNDTYANNLAIYQWRNYDAWKTHCSILPVSGGNGGHVASKLLIKKETSANSYYSLDIELGNDYTLVYAAPSSTKLEVGSFTGNVHDDLVACSMDANEDLILYESCAGVAGLQLRSLDCLNPTSANYALYNSYMSRLGVDTWFTRSISGGHAINPNTSASDTGNAITQVSVQMFVCKGGGVFMQYGSGPFFRVALDSTVGGVARSAGFRNSAVVY